jgi:hypothetical protein
MCPARIPQWGLTFTYDGFPAGLLAAVDPATNRLVGSD